MGSRSTPRPHASSLYSGGFSLLPGAHRAAQPTWAIIIRQTRELVGVIGLAPNDESKSAELGYYVAHIQWGHGFATEAAQAVVRWALDAQIYAKLTSRYHADNPASGRVLAKLGFKPVGYSKTRCRAAGTDKPTIDVELLA